MVYCSPGWPSNLKWGSIMNSTFWSFNLFASSWNSETGKQTPKWGTGTFNKIEKIIVDRHGYH